MSDEIPRRLIIPEDNYYILQPMSGLLLMIKIPSLWALPIMIKIIWGKLSVGNSLKKGSFLKKHSLLDGWKATKVDCAPKVGQILQAF